MSQQIELAVTNEMEVRKPSTMDLLQLALQKDAAIDVIERLSRLQCDMERFALDMRRVDAETEFNQELNRCQEEVKTVIADSDKTAPGGKKWATYKGLDKEIRPIYLRHGFSLSFGSADFNVPDMILVTCLVSRGLHTRTYQLPMDISGKGPQGGGALSRPHAILAAMEYGRRCLLKSIFNIVTGDEDLLTNGELMEQIEFLDNARNLDELKKLYAVARDKFEANPPALKLLIAKKDARKKELS